ncbi:MAG TPA: NAD(P)/FAD-dependent oxidoreductase [Reyranella sp.]|nr:NAD(P)/FAD-dependent oxidoreductase [Reyranella sp.]
MAVEEVDTVVIGGGQAGIAMSEHLGSFGIPHLVLERHRIAERWRSERWDSLAANGPAWHDRFPNMQFPTDPDAFPNKEVVAAYFEAYAKKIAAPIRCGVDVKKVERRKGRAGFALETSHGPIEANSVVVATGPFQVPIIPPIVPKTPDILQLHSSTYHNPEQLPKGAVLVVGAGSSGVQIAEELLLAGRRVYLSVGPHERPPRAYRGRDYCWWLGMMGKWDLETRIPGREHITLAVSGARGGHTIDFRRLAAQGMTLLGMTDGFKDGSVTFKPDLAHNIADGDKNYLAVLDEADAYVRQYGIDLPEEPGARAIGADPECMTKPILSLNLAEAGVKTILWATGYSSDYSWLKVDAFDAQGKPKHQRGVSSEPGVYFLGLPWQSRRGSAFIWGVWHDAKHVADRIATQRRYVDYHASKGR